MRSALTHQWGGWAWQAGMVRASLGAGEWPVTEPFDYVGGVAAATSLGANCGGQEAQSLI